jgi:hypothetical protein
MDNNEHQFPLDQRSNSPPQHFQYKPMDDGSMVQWTAKQLHYGQDGHFLHGPDGQ